MILPDELLEALGAEMAEAEQRFGPYSTAHEVSAVLREEFEEYWDSVKADTPDPNELLQVAAVALRAILQDASLRYDGSPRLEL